MGTAAIAPVAVSPRRPWRRRWRIAGLLAGALLAIVVGWLLSHLRDRSATFVERRGRVARVEPGAEITNPGGYLSQPVRVTATTGLVVDFRVLRPATTPSPLPMIVVLGGHRTGRDAVDLIGDPQGVVVVALDYPYHGPERPRGVGQVLSAVPAAQRGLLDTPPAVSVALDWLVTQPWVDPARVELLGVSLGVPFAAVAGALDPRFRRVWLIHGGVDNRAWLANRLAPKIPNDPLRHSTAALLHLLAYGSSFRTEQWTPRIAPRPVVIVGAIDDEQMPPANVRSLHLATREPKELHWTEGQHVGARRPEVVRQLLDLVRARISDPSTAAAPPE